MESGSETLFNGKLAALLSPPQRPRRQRMTARSYSTDSFPPTRVVPLPLGNNDSSPLYRPVSVDPSPSPWPILLPIPLDFALSVSDSFDEVPRLSSFSCGFLGGRYRTR